MKKEKYKYEIDFSLPVVLSVKNTTSEVIPPFHNKPPFLPLSLYGKNLSPPLQELGRLQPFSPFLEGVGDSNCVTRARKETFARQSLKIEECTSKSIGRKIMHPTD